MQGHAVNARRVLETDRACLGQKPPPPGFCLEGCKQKIARLDPSWFDDSHCSRSETKQGIKRHRHLLSIDKHDENAWLLLVLLTAFTPVLTMIDRNGSCRSSSRQETVKVSNRPIRKRYA
jgi:hypothetical protein